MERKGNDEMVKKKTPGAEPPNGEQKKKIRLIVLILLLAAAVIGGGLGLYLHYRAEVYHDDDFYDPTAKTGVPPDLSETELKEMLNRVVGEGMLNISIADTVYFPDGSSEGKANIFNLEANRYVIKVTIRLDDTGETVYESKGVKPGQFVDYIKLDVPLSAGTYPATATFAAYTLDTHQIVGSAAAKIDLIIIK